MLFITFNAGYLSIHAVDSVSKHPDNFAVTLTKQHFNHAPVDRALVSQLPPCVLGLCVHMLRLGRGSERGLGAPVMVLLLSLALASL